MYPCYNRRKHPTLEKPGAQNITEYENQGKQCELSDYWKPKEKKVVFEKKKQQEMTQKKKKTKWLKEIQVLIKVYQ